MSSKPLCVESLESRRLLSFTVVDRDIGFPASTPLAADFNNDLVEDLALTSYRTGIGSAVNVLPGNGDGTFAAARTYPMGVPLYGGTASTAAADFDGDGNIDLVAANYYDNAIGAPTVLLGNGDGTLQSPQGVEVVLPPPPPGPYLYLYSLSTTDVAVADANADGVPDLLFTGEVEFNDLPGEGPYLYGYTAASLGRGDGTFSAAFGMLGPAGDFVAADLNADGKVDIVGANGARYGQGDGTFGAWQAFSGAQGHRVAVDDFNGDGKLDVAATDVLAGGGFIRLGNGDGTVRAAQTFVSGSIPQSVGTADFNGDGKTDLVTANGEYALNIPRLLTVCLGKGDGTFQSPLSFAVAPADSYNSSNAAVADFNGDGRADITVAAGIPGPGGGSNLRVLLNDGAWTTRTYIGPDSGGNWSTAANWSPAGVPTASDVVTISGKSVNVSASTTVGGLNLTGGATLNVIANGSRVLRTSSLSIAPNSTLNLADNDLVLDYSGVSPVGAWTGGAYDGVTGMIQSGRITSSLAGNLKTLGVAEAREVLGITGSQTATFAGQAVDSTSVLVKFTSGGDATLDGKINVDDYGRIDGNVSQSGSVWGWFNGDFNLDGKINIDDYGIIDGNIHQQDDVL